MLFRAGGFQRRLVFGQRRVHWHRIGGALFILFSLLSGCVKNQSASLERSYAEARLQFQRGYDQQALQAAEAGYNDSVKDPKLNWKFLVLMAEIAIRQGRPEEALGRIASLPPVDAAPEVPWRRKLAQTIAVCQLKRFAQADQYFSEAEQLATGNIERQTELMFYHGRCEVVKGRESDLKEAQNHFTEVENSPSADGFVRAWSQANLGLCARLTHHFDVALDWYVKARKAFHSLQALPLEQRMLGTAGFLYFETGNMEKARESSHEAAELAAKLGQNEDQKKWLLDLGRVYMAQRQFALAEQTYEKSLALAKKQNDRAIAARCLHNLVQMKLSQKDVASANAYHKLAQPLQPTGDDLRDFKIDDADLASTRGEWSTAEKLLLEVLPELKEDARRTWSVQAGLARACVAQNKTRQADQWFQQSIATMEAASARMNRTEFKIAMLNNWPVFDDYIAFLERQKQPERALQVAQMARARTLAEQLGFKQRKEDAKAWVSRIQGMLRARNALILAYYEAAHTTYLWAITPKRLLPFKLVAGQNELETLADSYAREIQEHSSLEESTAQQKLYQILVKPVREHLPKGSHVILVADSALYRINFETLISNEGPLHYWIEDAELENACSIDLLLAGQHSRRHGKGLLLIGAPDQATPEFPSLPNAPQEMENVRKHFPPAEVTRYSAAAATPEAYSTSNPGQFKYVEFATHGKPSASDPMDSSIILSRGANGKFELYAKEIIADKLKLNADLVTFSACYGAGKVASSAEGLLGLQWAFLRAGAHQVVAGLWDVDDESVPQLMGGLYEGVVKGRKSAPASLRTAKLAMLRSGGLHSAPYYWAALQVYTGP